MAETIAIDYEPLAPAVQADPYPFYAALRRESPVHFVETLQAFAVSRHADVRRVMHDHVTFSSEAMAALVARPAEYAAEADLLESGDAASYPVSIVGADGDVHRRLRLVVNRAFTPKRIGRLEDEVRRVSRGFVGQLVAHGTGELQAGLAVPLPTVVIAELLGVDAEQRDDFRRWSEHMVRGVFEPLAAEEQAAVAQCSEQMGEWLDAQIAARAGRDGDDLISLLLRAEAEGGALTPEELQVFVITLLVAGSITTAYLIGTAARLLAADAARLAVLKAEPARIPAFVEETLRYDAPTQMMFRTATTDVDVAGTTIPRGATVLALLGSANRDESVFDDPDTFDPDRDASDHLSFGHGVHFCLGAALARLEARVVLEELVRGASRLELAGEIESVSSIVFREPNPAAAPVHLTTGSTIVTVVNPTFSSVIADEAQLRGLYREPSSVVQRKKVPRIDDAARRLIAASPFCLVATADADGHCDVSPRGGPPGFVRTLDERRLAIPDLNGNNLLDSLSNIVRNPHVGLLFVIPGHDETFRAEGHACLTTDPDILALWDDELRRPHAAIGVEVKSVFVHCAKSFRRGRVWDPDSWAELDAPDNCEVIGEQLGFEVTDEIHAGMEASYARDLANDLPDA